MEYVIEVGLLKASVRDPKYAIHETGPRLYPGLTKIARAPVIRESALDFLFHNPPFLSNSSECIDFDETSCTGDTPLTHCYPLDAIITPPSSVNVVRV